MKFFDTLKKRNISTVFFVLAFTIGILIFLIGNSAIMSEKSRIEDFASKNQKAINFQNYEDIKFSEVFKFLEKRTDLSTTFRKVNYSKEFALETRFLSKNEELQLDMKSGICFTKDQLKDNGNTGIYSTRFDNEIEENVFGTDKNIKINKVGSYYETDRLIQIPNKLFEELYKDDMVTNVHIIVRGNEDTIQKLVSDLEYKFKDRKISGSQNGIVLKKVELITDLAESKALQSSSIFIFIITIINSISISSLWVKNRKKEIVLRKVFGAKNIDIVKIFFGELTIISLISVSLALIIQKILFLITTGFIASIDLSFNVTSFLYSIMVSVLVAFLTAIPSLRNISKIQLAEMLKEE